MGCAGSAEGENSQYQQESEVKVNKEPEPPKKEKPKPQPQPQPVEEVEKLPAPTGEQFFVMIGDRVRISSHLHADAFDAEKNVLAGTTVKDVVTFCNWFLAKHKDKLPKGYDLEKTQVTGLTSPFVLSDGLIFCPEDHIHELDGFDDEGTKEHYLVAITSEWKINSGPVEGGYNAITAIMDQSDEPAGSKNKRREDYWKGLEGNCLIEYHATDLHASILEANAAHSYHHHQQQHA